MFPKVFRLILSRYKCEKNCATPLDPIYCKWQKVKNIHGTWSYIENSRKIKMLSFY